MAITKELVRKYQALHVNKFDLEISYETAAYQLKDLAELVRLTSKIEAENESL